MVLHQVEEPLFRAVMEYTQQNQSSAATMLGLNRGTLRKSSDSMAYCPNPKSQNENAAYAVRAPPRDRQPTKEAINHE